jgi:hypothetical protein
MRGQVGFHKLAHALPDGFMVSEFKVTKAHPYHEENGGFFIGNAVDINVDGSHMSSATKCVVRAFRKEMFVACPPCFMSWVGVLELFELWFTSLVGS